jgi:hypothetical protein
MARCCWARRANFGLQTESLEEERDIHRIEMSRRLATGCDRVDTGLVTAVKDLKEAHIRTTKPHEGICVKIPTRACGGNLCGNGSVR